MNSTLSSKGQIVIPKAIRDQLGLRAGDLVDFVIRDGGEVAIIPSKGSVMELEGLLVAKRKVSLAAMKRAIRMRGGRS